jgi:hypothetical protein
MARRVLIAFVVFLLVGPLIGLVLGGSQKTSEPGPTAPPRIGTPQILTNLTATAQLPRDRVVHARVGEFVSLEVTVRRPDSVEIPALGLTHAAAPGSPAVFTFVPDRPGTLGVELSISDRNAGQIVVSPR